MKRRFSLLAVVLGILACGSVAQAQALKKISVGDVAPIAADWPHFVAEEKGFYRGAGVAPEVIYVGNVANTVKQLVGGSFDIAVSTFDTAVRAIANGGTTVMIGASVVKYPYSIMVTPDIRSVGDLRGKRIVLPFAKDLLTVAWNRWVREQGIDPKEIDQIYDGATPNRFAALTSGVVQAALLGQPFDFKAADQGDKTLLDIGAYAKDYGFLVILSRPDWLSAHGDEARGYLRALAQAVDWIYDPANRDEAIAILARGTKLDPGVAGRTYDYYVKELQPFSRNLAIPDRIVKATVATLVDLGDIKAPDRPLTDTAYLPH
ncbi:MAG TPA: ABC transporter substrate-binding protein [Stellaceae bacterium]|nr:ABC transporter substrate-binding protein [Stellaceae bacterium]